MEYQLLTIILLLILILLYCYELFYMRKNVENIKKKNKKINKNFIKNNIDINSLEDIESIIKQA